MSRRSQEASLRFIPSENPDYGFEDGFLEEKEKPPLSGRMTWLLVGVISFVVLVILLAVFNHDKDKPKRPQDPASIAVNQVLAIKEWKPGMGPKPWIYHPAAFNEPVWRPLPPGPNSPRR